MLRAAQAGVGLPGSTRLLTQHTHNTHALARAHRPPYGARQVMKGFSGCYTGEAGTHKHTTGNTRGLTPTTALAPQTRWLLGGPWVSLSLSPLAARSKPRLAKSSLSLPRQLQRAADGSTDRWRRKKAMLVHCSHTHTNSFNRRSSRSLTASLQQPHRLVSQQKARVVSR